MSGKKRAVKKGFSFLSFFLGIFFGIIILIGALFGAGYFALSADLDKVLGVAGLDNGKDENGRNKYINTDPDNGGVKNLMELLGKVAELSSDLGGLTLGRVDELFPAANGMVEGISASFSQYVDIGAEELKNVKFADFGSFISGVVMDIRPAALISGEMNHFMRLMLEGVEADCVVADGTVCPLYYDEGADVYAYSAGGSWYVAEKTADGFAPTGNVFEGYNAETIEATGNYYVNGEEKVFIDPITIGSLSGEGGMGALGKISIVELLGEENNNGLVNDLLGDVTVQQFMNGETDINSKVDALEVSQLMDVDINDKLSLYIAYGLSDLRQDEEGAYTATYKLGEADIPVNVTVEEGKITSVTDSDGQKIEGTKVGSLSSITDNLDVSVFLNVTVDNKIVAYLAYGITDITADADGNYTAKKEGAPCTLETDGNDIKSVTLDETGEKISAATVSDFSGRVDAVSSELKIRDIVNVDGSKILSKLGDYTLDTISEGVEQLEITDITDIDTDGAIMPYLAYGITRINREENTAYLGGEKVYLKTESGEEGKTFITGVYRTQEFSGEAVHGTKVNEINGRINGMMDEMTIGEFMDGGIDESNTILYALRRSTINRLSDDVANLTINEIYADRIYGERGGGKAVLKKVKKAHEEGEGIEFNADYLYYTLESDAYGEQIYKLVTVGDQKGKLTEESMEAGKEYYTYGAPTEFWQLLVTKRSDKNASGDEQAYSLNHLTEMADNISHNMKYFTLKDLNKAGILDFGGVDLDNTEIPGGIETHGGQSLGSLTVPEAISVMVAIINKFPSLG